MALTALLVSCEAEPARRVRFIDLVTVDVLRSTMGEAEPADEYSCADENRFAQPIRDGEELYVTGHLGELGKLVLSTCANRPPHAAPGTGTLRVTVVEGPPPSRPDAQPGLGVEAVLPVPLFSRWQRHRVDLAGLADREVTLRLTATLPAGRTLYLQDLYVEHLEALAGRQEGRRKNEEQPVFHQGAAPQVLLISVDTLREDALSVLGGSHRTPALDAFAGKAQIFQPHYSAAAWTLPSHATMLTGQPPPVHGAINGRTAIHGSVPTLAERFKAEGFATAGLTFDCYWLGSQFGFDRGFDSYRSVLWTLPQRVRQTLNWVDEHRDRPFFYFLHTFEPHSDYRSLPYEGPDVRPGHVAERFGLAERYGCREGHCSSALLQEINRGTVAPLPGEEEILRYLYQRGIDHLDDQLATLFAGLEKRGLFDNMLIVLTSDHGESFFEHGQLLHGHHWQEELRVPLLIKWPSGVRAGERVTTPTSSLDLVPTLLHELGMDTTGLPGANLLRRRADRPVFSGSNFDVVIAGRWKAVWSRKKGERWLFDLTADPGEQHNLAEERPAELSRLEALISQRQERQRWTVSRFDQTAKGVERLSEEERWWIEAAKKRPARCRPDWRPCSVLTSR